MNAWHNNMSRISTCRDVGDNMIVTQFLDALIPAPAISPDFSSRFHVIFNESVKARCGDIGNNGHAYSTRSTSPDFCCYGNNRLPLSTSPTDFSPTAANVCLIDFDGSGQLLSPRAHHRTTQFMEPSPRCIVAAKSENSLQTESACSMLLACQKPYGQKPGPQRFVRLVKQRSRSYRCLPFTFSAKKKAALHLRGFFRSISANGAAESFWPPKFGNVVKASLFAAKPFIKLLECSRIINARNRVSFFFHDHILRYVIG